MLVVFGDTLPKFSWRNKIEEMSVKDLCDKFLSSKLSNLCPAMTDKYLKGYLHTRINNLAPPVNSTELKDYLLTETKYKNSLNNIALSSVSFHGAYVYNHTTLNNVDNLINYYTRQGLILKHLGITVPVYHINHCYGTPQSIIDTYKEIQCSLDYPLINFACLENCDKTCSLETCIQVSRKFKIPIVYDNLHNHLNNYIELETVIEDIAMSWEGQIRPPKIHYSNGDMSGHNSVLDLSELLTICFQYKRYFNKLIVLLELKQAPKVLQDFKFKTLNSLDWNSDYSFII